MAAVTERPLGDARRVGGGAHVGRQKWVSDGNSNTALGDNSNSNTRVDLGFLAQELLVQESAASDEVLLFFLK